MSWNRRTLLAAFVALGILPPAADAKPKPKKHKKHHTHTATPTPEPTPDAEPTPETTVKKRKRKTSRDAQSFTAAALVSAPAAPCLVKRYYGAANNGVDAYQPWQFAPGLPIKDAQRTVNGQPSTWVLLDAGPFAGADAFCFGRVTGGHSKEGGNKWAEFDVQRDVTVGYVWRDGGAPPAWIAADGWALSGTVDAKNPDKGWGGMAPDNKVYTKNFQAGRIAIKGPSDGTTVKVLPWLLFAEKDGAIPTKPADYDAPNQPCSKAYHDSIKARNSNFLTEHPQIDYGRSHCDHEHEHGGSITNITKDPAAFVRFGEVAKIVGMTENAHGYKQYPVKMSDGKWLFVMTHFGTTGVLRADTCKQRYHEVWIRLYSPNGDTLLAERKFMGDFGISSGCQVQDSCGIALDTATCPNGNRDTGYTNNGQGSRQIPVTPFGLNGNGYEPWLVNLGKLALGFKGKLVVNTTDAIDICDGPGCNGAVRTTVGTGTARFLTLDTDDDGAAFTIAATGKENANGYFCTDGFGKTDLSCGDPMAVRHYTKPGLNWVAGTRKDIDIEAGHMGGADVARWGAACQQVPTGVPGDAEGSIFTGTRRSQNPSSN